MITPNNTHRVAPGSSQHAGSPARPTNPQAPDRHPGPPATHPQAPANHDDVHLSDEARDDVRANDHASDGDLGRRIADSVRGSFDERSQQAAQRGVDARSFHSQIRDQVMGRVEGNAAPGGLPSSPSSTRAYPASASSGLGAATTSPLGPGRALPTEEDEAPTGAGSTGTLGSLGPALDQWDPTILREAEKWGVPPERIKAMMAIESGGDPNALQVNPTYGDTAGLMQINPKIWGDQARNLGYDLNTPDGQIGMASWLLREGYRATGSWDGASSWYFNPSGTGDSVNGTSNAQYVQAVNDYIAQMRS